MSNSIAPPLKEHNVCLSSEIRYKLNYLSESTATFSKLSIYGQGKGHRSNKSAQNVSFSVVCDSVLGLSVRL